MAKAPFVAASTIVEQLGDTALDEIARNLWPMDCQACGQPFVGEVPSLVILDALGGVTSAVLYHRACRSSEIRTEKLVAVGGAYLTYDVVAALLAVEHDDGTPAQLPLVMINPSLEQVLLRHTDDGWKCATAAHFRAVGLRGIDLSRPVPGARVEFVDGGLRVWVGVTGGQCWDCPVEVASELRAIVQDRGGVAVALTTAYHPNQLINRSVEDFVAALGSDEVATGWIALDATATAGSQGQP